VEAPPSKETKKNRRPTARNALENINNTIQSIHGDEFASTSTTKLVGAAPPSKGLEMVNVDFFSTFFQTISAQLFIMISQNK
jgi:hypothetical protein